ncbi:MAG TPA: hypothetical protein VL123_05265 [Candidatus Udaeobacter sp.]|jgi:hypothetical protein|nr:hypothetical protein [Candidatus Udaeobacter sp.]
MEPRPPAHRDTFVELRPRPEPELLAARAALPPAARRMTAVIVVHGMGQQVPFETLEQVANLLRDADQARREAPRSGSGAPAGPRAGNSAPAGPRAGNGAPAGPRVVVDEVMLGEKQLPRAELRVAADGGHRDVHLYEAYWAPATEGRVTLRDTISFLVRSGLNSLLHVRDRTFDRWMFGRWIRFLIYRGRTALELLAVLLLLGSLIFVNAVITAAMASHTLTGGGAAWPPPPLFRQITLDLALLIPSALSIVIGATLVPAWLRGRALAARLVPSAAAGDQGLPIGSLLGWFLVGVGAAGIVAIAAFMLRHVVVGPGLFMTHLKFRGALLFPPGDPVGTYGMLAAWMIWLVAIAVSLSARWFLVEYVGDVAAYVSSHTVSRFAEVRHQIHEIAMSVARPVYAARGPGGREPLYDRLVVVGHSLGSVVAYDMLNAIILEDRLKGLPYDAAHRTEMLLTFGSPLEKTAYLFRTQRPRAAEVREALAAAVQPMIQNYVSRPRFWVNLHSPNDIISGHLRFYDAEDPPEGGSRRVENIVDPDADQPLLAHNQYWTNPLLASVLLDGVTGAWTPGVRGEQGPRAMKRGI